MIPTATTHRVWVPGLRQFRHFTPRHQMRRRALKPHIRGAWPTPTLPVGYVQPDDAIIPIDGNDRLGICGPCMGAHVDNVLTFRATGTASKVSDLNAFEAQYEAVSGGDNGTDEQMMTGQVWGPPAGIAGITPAGAVLQDHLDISLDAPTVQGAIAAQGFVCMAFSVPDAWISNFDQNGGAVWDAPATPNPANGHFVALVGVDGQGRYILLTWGSYVYLTQAGLESCDAELFTGWTNRAFDPATGLAFDGQPFAAKAAAYRAAGGNPPPNPFPTPGPNPQPTPGPTPTPQPPAPPALGPRQVLLDTDTGVIHLGSAMQAQHSFWAGANVAQVHRNPMVGYGSGWSVQRG